MIHRASFHGTGYSICGLFYKDSRRKEPELEMTEDSEKVTCRICLDILGMGVYPALVLKAMEEK